MCNDCDTYGPGPIYLHMHCSGVAYSEGTPQLMQVYRGLVHGTATDTWQLATAYYNHSLIYLFVPSLKGRVLPQHYFCLHVTVYWLEHGNTSYVLS